MNVGACGAKNNIMLKNFKILVFNKIISIITK